MWAIYHNYKKIFPSDDLKALKKLKMIKEDSKLSKALNKTNVRVIDGRS